MRIVLSKNTLLIILVGIITYLYIYNPPFVALPFTPIKLLYPVAFFYLWQKRLFHSFINCYKIELALFLCIVGYSFFRGMFTSEFYYAKTNLITLIETLFLSYFIVVFYLRKIKNIRFIDFFIDVAGVAALISVCLILFPDLNEYVRDGLLKKNEYSELLLFRNFGFSEGLTYAYGITQGIALSLCLFYPKKRRNLFLIPLFFIAILFNARTGFVPVLFTVFYLLFTNRGVGILIKLFVGISFVVFILFTLPVFENFTKTIEWGFSFFTQLSDFALQKENGNTETFDVLFGNMLIFPSTIWEYIWGSGRDIFLVPGKNTDIGYLLQLNFGGIIYCLFLFGLVFNMFLRLYSVSKAIRFFSFFFLTVILIVNVKGYFLFTSPAYRTFFLLYVYIMTTSRRNVGQKNTDINQVAEASCTE